MATARKTAAEKRAEAKAAEALRMANEWAEFLQSYPTRFAAVLFFYANTGNGFSVRKLDAETYEFRNDDRLYRQEPELKVTPPQNYDREYLWLLESVERVMEEYLEEQAEQERRYRVREAALARAREVFSDEERQLLGL